MIDWDAPDPQPDFERGNVVELRTMGDAIKLLDEWQEAYRHLEGELCRLDHAWFLRYQRLEMEYAFLNANYNELWVKEKLRSIGATEELAAFESGLAGDDKA